MHEHEDFFSAVIKASKIVRLFQDRADIIFFIKQLKTFRNKNLGKYFSYLKRVHISSDEICAQKLVKKMISECDSVLDELESELFPSEIQPYYSDIVDLIDDYKQFQRGLSEDLEILYQLKETIEKHYLNNDTDHSPCT